MSKFKGSRGTRSKFEAYAAVLECCRNVPRLKAGIALHAKINFCYIDRRVRPLLEAGLLERVLLKKKRFGYLTTRRGGEWLGKYYVLVGMLNFAEAQIK